MIRNVCYFSYLVVLIALTLFLIHSPEGMAALGKTGTPDPQPTPQTFTGTNKCEIYTNRDGEKAAEMWCAGTYYSSGTCTGAPGQTTRACFNGYLLYAVLTRR
jgi:hypothetical protein